MSSSDPFGLFRTLAGQSLVDDILAYEKVAQQKPNLPVSSELAWKSLGNTEEIREIKRGLYFKCEQGWVALQWLAPDCLHVQGSHASDTHTPPFSYAVSKHEWPSVELSITRSEHAVIVKTASLTYHIGTQPFRIRIETLDGRPICRDSAGMQLHEDGAVRLSLKMHPEETCYGLGERAAGLNLRGKSFSLWNTDPPTYQRGDDPLYYSIPFYLGLHSMAYGVFWDNPSRGRVDVGETTASEIVFESEAGRLNYYLFAGQSINAVLSRYTELTGRIQLPPIWFLGYQQCRWSYYPQAEVLALAKQFRDRNIPCDVIYLDIHYMDGFRVFTWDEENFPDPKQMIDTLHQQGFKVIAIVDPGIKVDPNYAAYQSGIDANIFLKYPDGRLVTAPVWPGMCHFPDFTDSEARQWWQAQCSALLNTGLDGLWNDMCEPAVFREKPSGTLPDTVQHEMEGRTANHREGHNVYGMQMARATYDAIKKHRPDKRPVTMLRAGYAGSQRYASSWTGDNSATWDHLHLSIAMTLNMGLSGAPITGPDVGGFFGDTDEELLIRWLQAACLMPYFRNHTALGTANQEPWVYGKSSEAINRKTIGLRYHLLPYLYSVVALCGEYGWPVIKPLFMAEPHNPDLRSIDDCYLLGDGLLVAPIVEQGASSRSVYLPTGSNWYDFWTNEYYRGGREIEVNAPIDTLPLFVRAGLTLPLWPEMPHVGAQPIDKLILRVYPGNYETTLYEDAGEGMTYEQGDYRWVYITTTQEDDQLLLNRRIAGKYEPAYSSIGLEVVGLPDEPAKVRVDRQGAPLWFYDEDILEMTVDAFRSIEITHKPSSSDRTLLSRPW